MIFTDENNNLLIDRDGIIVAKVPRMVEEKWPRIAQRMALAAQQDGAWQEIETAPKDGTDVLVAECGAVMEAHYDAEVDQWWLANTDRHDYVGKPVYPTHWRPLPAPPPT